ncbi:MAG: hypothetical protein C0621_07645 [Desulfuromonas sp.]|nr:MAG: hypothetical protein C0621_07645 [Desulfuromonas sp.]
MPFRFALLLLVLSLYGILGGCALNREKLAAMKSESDVEKTGAHLEALVDFLRSPPEDPALYAEAIETGYTLAIAGEARRTAPTPYYMFHKELRRNFAAPDRSPSRSWIKQQYSPDKVSELLSSWALLGLARLEDPDMLETFVETLGVKQYCTPNLAFQRAAAEGIDGLIDHVTTDATLRSTLLVKIAAARDCAAGTGTHSKAREALLQLLNQLEERGTSLATFNSIFSSSRFPRMAEEEQQELLRMTYQLLNNQLSLEGRETDPDELRRLLTTLGDFAMSGRLSGKVTNSIANTLFTVIPTYYSSRLLAATPTRPELFRLTLLLRDQEEDEWRRATEAGESLVYNAGNKRPVFNPYPLFGDRDYRKARATFDAIAGEQLDNFLSKASDKRRSEMLALLLRDDPELLGTTLLMRMGKSHNISTSHLSQEMAFVEQLTARPADFPAFFNQVPFKRDDLLIASTIHPDATQRLPLILPHYLKTELPQAAGILTMALADAKTPSQTLPAISEHLVATLEKIDATMELPQESITFLRDATRTVLLRRIDSVNTRLLGYWQQKDPELALTILLDAYYRPSAQPGAPPPEPEPDDLLLLGKLMEHSSIEVDSALYNESKSEIMNAMKRQNDEVALLATRLAYRSAQNDEATLATLERLTHSRWSASEEVSP